MNRRAFIALLTAPMIVRASSLDALPRGVPLRRPEVWYWSIDISPHPGESVITEVWFDGGVLQRRVIEPGDFYRYPPAAR